MSGHELAGGLAAIGLFAAPGYALTGCFPALRRRPPAQRAAFGYLLGLATVAGALFGLSHACGLPLRRPAVLAVAAVPFLVATAVGAARRRQRQRRARRGAAPVCREAAGGSPVNREATGTAREHREPAAAAPAERVAATAAAPAAPTPREQGTAGAGGWTAGAAPALSPWAGWPRGLGGPAAAVCLLAAALIAAGVLAEAALNPVRDFDGRMTWDTQARYLRAAGTVDAGVLLNERWFVTHPRYPLLLPVAQVAVLEALGADPDSHAVRFLYAGCFAALLLVLYDGVRRAAGRRAAAVIVLAAAAIPFFVHGEGGATSTFSDLPLACFYGAACVLLLAPRPAPGDGLAAGLLLAGAALTKDEGLPLALLALVLGWRAGTPKLLRRLQLGRRTAEHKPMPVHRAPAEPGLPAERDGGAPPPWAGRGGNHSEPPAARTLRAAGVRPTRRGAALRMGLAAAPILAAAVLLVAWRAGIPDRQDEGYAELARQGGWWSAAAAHVTAAVPVVWRRMTSFDSWAGFWWMAAALLAAGRRALRGPRNRRRLAAAAGPLAIAWAAYVVYPNPAYLASVTWDRFLLQGCVPFLIVLACALRTVRRDLVRRWQRRGAAAPPAGASG
jgi:hypothetical protein